MCFLKRWRGHSFLSFGVFGAAVLLLTLYSPSAACEEETAGPEESETAAPSDPPEEDPNCEPKPAWWTEEARIMRLQGTASGPECEDETNAEPDRNAEVGATVTATVLTGTFGFGATTFTAFGFCAIADATGEIDSECIKGPLALGIVGGIAFGFGGYKNEPLTIMLSSSMLLLTAGVTLADSMEAPEIMQSSMGILGGVGGAYLGYRLWRVRQPTGPLNLFIPPESFWARTSISPYLNRERSGLVMSGRF